MSHPSPPFQPLEAGPLSLRWRPGAQGYADYATYDTLDGVAA